MFLDNYRGYRYKVPIDVIRKWRFRGESKLRVNSNFEVEVLNIFILGTGMDMINWNIREDLCGGGIINIVSHRNLEELERLEVTERVLNELK
jgi:hypothetical protein